MAIYGYLFWDSVSPQACALTGGSPDMLFMRDDRFMDWVNTLRSAALALPYANQGQGAMPVYPPFCYAVLRPLALLLQGSAAGTGLVRAVWIGLTGIVLLEVCRNVDRLCTSLNARRSDQGLLPLLVLVLVSYPFLFAFDRGNLELIAFGLVSWFVVRLFSPGAESSLPWGVQRIVRSSLILAAAASIKPYTFLFVCLAAVAPDSGSHRQRLGRLLQIGLCTLGFVLLFSVLSLLWLYQGDFAQGIQDYRYWQEQFRKSYVLGGAGDQFFVSPYVAIKRVLLAFAGPAPGSVLRLFSRIYPLLALLVSGAVLLKAYHLCRRRPNPVISLTAICFGLLVFPYNANEYKAIYLLLPFLLFLHGTGSESDCLSTVQAACLDAGGSLWRVFGELLRSHAVLSFALCFGLLLNRYGILGHQYWASRLGSLLLIVFPVFFLFPRGARTSL